MYDQRSTGFFNSIGGVDDGTEPDFSDPVQSDDDLVVDVARPKSNDGPHFRKQRMNASEVQRRLNNVLNE